MRFQTADPDIATIIRRIQKETIDLQPDFQRGEVWSVAKKQRLIDSILRRWHVPPIHLVAKGGGRFDVLDGQQRLTSIRDFMNGLFPVDGAIEPIVPEFAQLNGLRFSQLPPEVRDEFESFAIRVFELHDYTPDEPHELFFRLNQPVALTEAEKRNAFVGAARNQVKELSDWATQRGMIPPRLGFSNARMAYHDLISRFMLTLEQRNLTEKITSLRITTRYRSKEPFEQDVVRRAEMALQFYLGLDLLDRRNDRMKPNKATVHTWLCMAAKLNSEGALESSGDTLGATIDVIERWRTTRTMPLGFPDDAPLGVFQDRSTARVADVSSVVLRDLTAWMVFSWVAQSGSVPAPQFLDPLSSAWAEVSSVRTDADRLLTRFSLATHWGGVEWI